MMLKMNLHIKGETMNNDHPEAAINLSVSIYFILLYPHVRMGMVGLNVLSFCEIATAVIGVKDIVLYIIHADNSI